MWNWSACGLPRKRKKSVFKNKQHAQVAGPLDTIHDYATEINEVELINVTREIGLI
jgi:hypothetical protein